MERKAFGSKTLRLGRKLDTWLDACNRGVSYSKYLHLHWMSQWKGCLLNSHSMSFLSYRTFRGPEIQQPLLRYQHPSRLDSSQQAAEGEGGKQGNTSAMKELRLATGSGTSCSKFHQIPHSSNIVNSLYYPYGALQPLHHPDRIRSILFVLWTTTASTCINKRSRPSRPRPTSRREHTPVTTAPNTTWCDVRPGEGKKYKELKNRP